MNSVIVIGPVFGFIFATAVVVFTISMLIRIFHWIVKIHNPELAKKLEF